MRAVDPPKHGAIINFWPRDVEANLRRQSFDFW